MLYRTTLRCHFVVVTQIRYCLPTPLSGRVAKTCDTHHFCFKHAPGLLTTSMCLSVAALNHPKAIITPISTALHCGRSTLKPSLVGAAARLNATKLCQRYDLDSFFSMQPTLSHSSQALPAPKPRPIHAGHALLLNSSTEATMPKDRPRDERMSTDDRQRSHWTDMLVQSTNTF